MIGAYDDPAIGLVGVNRQSLTDDDAAGIDPQLGGRSAGMSGAAVQNDLLPRDRLHTGDYADGVALLGQVPFDEQIQDAVATAAAHLGQPTMRLMSRAGHDAQEIAAIAPTAMIFVRGQDDGISHNPREHSTPEDCALAISVHATTLVRLADQT